MPRPAGGTGKGFFLARTAGPVVEVQGCSKRPHLGQHLAPAPRCLSPMAPGRDVRQVTFWRGPRESRPFPALLGAPHHGLGKRRRGPGCRTRGSSGSPKTGIRAWRWLARAPGGARDVGKVQKGTAPSHAASSISATRSSKASWPPSASLHRNNSRATMSAAELTDPWGTRSSPIRGARASGPDWQS